ncbi:hypothetical protein T484DRAFT_1925006 [Baffinella frigidus]|nr:hypothetical protein T484DRAFT_1925006 [Cryptophyta sp. CCMP2293]
MLRAARLGRVLVKGGAAARSRLPRTQNASFVSAASRSHPIPWVGVPPVPSFTQRKSSEGFALVPRRALSAKADTAAVGKAGAAGDTRIVQEVPGSRFWNEVYESLDLDGLSSTPEGEQKAKGGTVIEWFKKPRDAVKKGDKLLEAEFFGIVVELKAERSGFLSQRYVMEGELLERGKHACLLLAEPEEEIALDRKAEDDLFANANGSVSSMQSAKGQIEHSRAARRATLSSAAHLMAIQGLFDGGATLLATRIPGQSPLLWVSPPALHLREMSKDALLEVDPSSASLSLVTSAVSSADEANFALALAIFKACPGVECVIVARPPYLAALSLIGGVTTGSPLLHADFDGALPACFPEGSAGARAVVLGGCGVVAAGASVEAAFLDIAALERASRAHLTSLAAGQPLARVPRHSPPPSPDEMARRAARDSDTFSSLLRLFKAGTLPHSA